MKIRFTEDDKIIAMIKEKEAGERTSEVCRRHGISEGTFYKYKSKYDGMEPSDAKRLRAIEDDNAKLKKLLAEQVLDNAKLRDKNFKKWGLPKQSHKLLSICEQCMGSVSVGRTRFLKLIDQQYDINRCALMMAICARLSNVFPESDGGLDIAGSTS